MSKVTMIRPRVAQVDTRRTASMTSETRRISGATRVSAKRRIYARDGGRCQICHCVVDLSDSELDHRTPLQHGGDNHDDNLWTLCVPCHAEKTKREASGHVWDAS